MANSLPDQAAAILERCNKDLTPQDHDQLRALTVLAGKLARQISLGAQHELPVLLVLADKISVDDSSCFGALYLVFQSLRGVRQNHPYYPQAMNRFACYLFGQTENFSSPPSVWDNFYTLVQQKKEPQTFCACDSLQAFRVSKETTGPVATAEDVDAFVTKFPLQPVEPPGAKLPLQALHFS